MRILFYILIITLILYILLLIAYPKLVEKIAIPCPKSSYKSLDNKIKIKTNAGEDIVAMYLPAEGSQNCIIYSHGNGEDLGTIEILLRAYQEQKVSVIAYDYTGYGMSSRGASEEKLLQAIDAVYDYALKMYDAENISAVGFSIGSVSTAHLASTKKLKASVFIAPLASPQTQIKILKLIPISKFDNISRAKQFKAPTLFIHGTSDYILSHKNSEILYKNTPAKKRLVYFNTYGHNNLTQSPYYFKEILNFINEPIKEDSIKKY